MADYVSDNPTRRFVIQSPENFDTLKESVDLQFGDKIYIISTKQWKIIDNQGERQDYSGT